MQKLLDLLLGFFWTWKDGSEECPYTNAYEHAERVDFINDEE